MSARLLLLVAHAVLAVSASFAATVCAAAQSSQELPDAVKVVELFEELDARLQGFSARFDLVETSPAEDVLSYFANERKTLEWAASSDRSSRKARERLASLAEEENSYLKRHVRQKWDVVQKTDGRYRFTHHFVDEQIPKGAPERTMFLSDGLRYATFVQYRDLSVVDGGKRAVIDATAARTVLPGFRAMLGGPVEIPSDSIGAAVSLGPLWRLLRCALNAPGSLRIESKSVGEKPDGILLIEANCFSDQPFPHVKSVRHIVKLWVDATRGMSPVRLEYGDHVVYTNDQLEEKVRMPVARWVWAGHKEAEPGLWLATEGSLSILTWKGEYTKHDLPYFNWPLRGWELQRIDFKIHDLRVNPPVEDAEFAFNFPEGTEVIDSVKNTGYIVGDVATLVGDQAAGFVAPPAQLSAQAAAGLPKSRSPFWDRWLWFGLGLAGVLTLASFLWLVRRLRRKSL